MLGSVPCMMKLPLMCALVAAGCVTTPVPTAQSASIANPVVAPPTPPKLTGLGPHTRQVSHASAEAQQWFDQGLNLVFAFNHDEAIRAFTWAATLSPQCAMCFWGIAYAQGPHINNPEMPPPAVTAALLALAKAKALPAEPEERAFIEALSTRYVDPAPASRAALDLAYADAMRAAATKYPTDADLASLALEALMDLHPWDLFAHGQPQPWEPEIQRRAEAALALAPKHPLANHLLIHVLEASDDPGRAMASADLLRDLTPGLGHQLHMPSHIDVRVGQWERAIASNQRAIEADDAYVKRSPEQNFYALYMAHNHQMLAWAAMMSGRGALAQREMKAMVDGIPEAFRQGAAALVDPFFSLPLEAMMRFGQWSQLLAVPEFPETFPASRAMRHGARGIAYAALRDVPHALEEQTLFKATAALVPADSMMGQNKVSALNEVVGLMLEGEILYATKKEDLAFSTLRRGVTAEDELRYDDPPDWLQPVRHALGAALVQSKKFKEAEAVFREDLRRIPGNGWSLFGLGQALRMQGQRAEAEKVEAQFKAVWSQADVELHSACLCQKGL